MDAADKVYEDTDKVDAADADTDKVDAASVSTASGDGGVLVEVIDDDNSEETKVDRGQEKI